MMRVCGVVMAGGASRRMGLDKLRLPLATGEATTVLDHAVQVARTVCERVFVLAAVNAMDSGMGDGMVTWLPDTAAHQGPLAALANAWPQFAQFDGVLVLAGDLPGLHEDVLRACVDRCFMAMKDPAAKSTDAALVQREGHLQPLLGVYRWAAGRAFHAVYETGEARLMMAIAGMQVATVEAEAAGWPTWWTRPVHTPQDYEDWLKEAQAR